MAHDGQEIAGYKLIKKIGEGGMGQVFLAEQLRLRRQVAIKLVHLDVKPDVPEGGTEPADELTREAEALMALEHPHILSLYDAGRDGDTAYLVMPYIPEGSLQDALRAGPRQQLQLPLPPGEALLYVEQAAAALQYAHDRNFIHRDVKPANFLIRSLSRTTGSGRGIKRLHLFLADFGLSKFLAYSSNTTHLSGTPTYMAPEQFQGHAVPASDQYSLAILFFYLLTGELPYRGTPVELMFHHLNETPPSPASRVGGIPESLARVVQRGMAKTPEERYPSVTGLAEAARDALVEAGMLVGQESSAMPVVRSTDLPAAKLPSSKPDALEPTKALDSSGVSSAQTITTDDLATSRDPVVISPQAAPAKPSEHSLPTIAGGRSDQGSLPTIAIEDAKPPARPPRGDDSAGQPRRRGWMIAVAAVAAIVLIGAILGSGLLLQIGPFAKSPTSAQASTATQAPTATPGVTATTTLTPTPTLVPPGDILNSILAHQPQYKVDLTLGDGQWDGPNKLNPNAFADIHTPSTYVEFQNASISFNGKTFSTPLAVAVDIHTASNQEFDLTLDTFDGGAHTYYRLRLTQNAPPQVAHSTDNKTFTTDGAGTSPNTAWTDGGTHTLILVSNGTRMLFYLDKQPLVDTTVLTPPHGSVTLFFASAGQSFMTGIRVYAVPQAG